MVAACTCKCNVALVTRVEPTASLPIIVKNVKAPLIWWTKPPFTALNKLARYYYFIIINKCEWLMLSNAAVRSSATTTDDLLLPAVQNRLFMRWRIAVSVLCRGRYADCIKLTFGESNTCALIRLSDNLSIILLMVFKLDTGLQLAGSDSSMFCFFGKGATLNTDGNQGRED